MSGWSALPEALDLVGDFWPKKSRDDGEIEDLQRRLSRAYAETTEQQNKVYATEKKLGVMASEVTQMTTDLREFTGAVLGLTVLSETRTHILFARADLERRYGSLAKAREHAVKLMRSVEEPELWNALLPEAKDALAETAPEVLAVRRRPGLRGLEGRRRRGGGAARASGGSRRRCGRIVVFLPGVGAVFAAGGCGAMA